MSLHRARVAWSLGDGDFGAGAYSRLHTLDFGDGLVVDGSPSPAIVAAPWSRQGAVDPEAAFVASLSACHMLWFLDLASKAGWIVSGYVDAAEGTLGRIAPGRMAMTRVTLKPAICFGGARPTPAELAVLHHEAHDRCFIANSVKTEVVVEGV